MRTRRLRTGLAAISLLVSSLATPIASAHEGPVTALQDYSTAQFVQVLMGQTNQEQGLHLVEGLPDGESEGLDNARKTVPGTTGADRWFYFDVHDSYLHGGLNKVRITVNYVDSGLTPVYLEYDSFDTLRPDSKEDSVIKKRVPLVNRTNTEAAKTVTINLEDARFVGSQPGGADFRIGSNDDLTIRNVAVLRVSYEKPMPPIRVVLDGKEVIFDILPMIDPVTNRTLVPMRALFNALGIPNGDIVWSEQTRTVTARKGQTIVALQIDNPNAMVNGVPVPLDQPAVIIGSRTLVPLRFVTGQFGLSTEWNPELRVITLTTKKP